MKPANESWNKMALRIDAMTLRERVIIFLAAAMGLIALMNALVLAPLEAEHKEIALRVQDDQNQVRRIREEIEQRVKASAADPDVQNRARLADLQAQVEEGKRSLAEIQRGVVAPDKMAALLEDLLRKNTRLRLIALHKLPATNLLAGSGDQVADSTLFRHGVELTVQGSYLDIMNYLAELERMPAQLLWGELSFRVDQHPNATMTVSVYTLSLDKQWLHI